ncbi:MAG: hypothetical protein N2442_14040 [Spirochaetes bacterium]|nr:hypothetical protein [Spirochaetota bacterium]
MPTESEILQHLLEAERKANELVKQAERSVAEKIEAVKREKEEQFRLLREEWQRSSELKLRAFQEELQEQKIRLLSQRKKHLETIEGQWENARTLLKTLLGIL